tara:strand:+ start:867 stop:992 length:126 start_codon:yes stop_codon:yes gene_type:complete
MFLNEGVSGGLEIRPGLSELFDFLEINPSVKQVYCPQLRSH